MALEHKSVDEETSELADAFDSLVAPKRLWRNQNNKLYLILRAFAAAKAGLTAVGLSLRNRYDPLYCDEVDLYSTAKLVGTDFKQGTGSIVFITILNGSVQEAKTLPAGVYNYRSVLGTVFRFELPNDRLFDPQTSLTVPAISEAKGSFPVQAGGNITLFRSDGGSIDSAFRFSCEDNAGSLGYGDESAFDFRSRILGDATRQDHIRELELKIRNLPSIFECSLILNEADEPQEYDGLTLAPKELLVTITGVPTDDVARLVAEDVLYATHMTDPAQVVYYYNKLFINGKYPVYYRPHTIKSFSFALTYRYTKSILTTTLIENSIKALFASYTNMTTHIDLVNEETAYNVLAAFDLPGVTILNVEVLDDTGTPVPYLEIPRTRLARMTGITFTAVEAGA